MQPNAPSADEPERDDVLLAKPKPIVNAAVVVGAGAGMLEVLLTLQMFALGRWPGLLAAWLILNGALGATLFVTCAFGVRRVKMAQSVVALGAATILSLSALAWILVSLYYTVFSLFAFAAVAANVAALALLIASLGSIKVAGEARQRLAESGLDMGL